MNKKLAWNYGPQRGSADKQTPGVAQLDNRNEPKINCFYNRPWYPCPFTTTESPAMESHYRQKHYPKEVIRG